MITAAEKKAEAEAEADVDERVLSASKESRPLKAIVEGLERADTALKRVNAVKCLPEMLPNRLQLAGDVVAAASGGVSF